MAPDYVIPYYYFPHSLRTDTNWGWFFREKGSHVIAEVHKHIRNKMAGSGNFEEGKQKVDSLMLGHLDVA